MMILSLIVGIFCTGISIYYAGRKYYNWATLEAICAAINFIIVGMKLVQ